MPHPLDAFADLDFYRQHFTDVHLWRPYVEEICQRHQLGCTRVRCGLPGTYPAFIVDERWVVKLFGQLFDGLDSYTVEQEAALLAAQVAGLPLPRLGASGSLQAGVWSWPYLVFEYLPGVSLGEVFAQVSDPEKLRLARAMGDWVRALHALPLPQTGIFASGARGPDGYADLIAQRRAACARDLADWNHLQPQAIPWLEQIERFLPPLAELVAPDMRLSLIHADLTRDHLLGQLTGSHGWKTLGLIDFGDARAGDLFYELQALYFDLFHGQKELLRAFFETYAYNGPCGSAFTRRALSFSFLHQFNVLGEALGHYPEALACPSLEELADLLWDDCV
jgi:hygromycin-B 7''-O-kinase